MLPTSRPTDAGEMPMMPAEFGKFFADENEKCGKVIRAHIEPA